MREGGGDFHGTSYNLLCTQAGVLGNEVSSLKSGPDNAFRNEKAISGVPDPCGELPGCDWTYASPGLGQCPRQEILEPSSLLFAAGRQGYLASDANGKNRLENCIFEELSNH